MAEKRLLEGIKVLDISHQYAGGMAAALLADYGAEVVQVESPRGGPMRSMLPAKEGESMWWKMAHRGKKCVSLNLNSDEGREMFMKMAKQFDVVTENFRPGTLEKWGIGPDDMENAGCNLVLMRISGFGQTGANSQRAGYGTIGEAMCGLAYQTGEPDGLPMFTSVTLADSLTGTMGALGILAALLSRKMNGGSGVEVVDCALVEAMIRVVAPTQIPVYDQLGIVAERIGNYLGSHGTLRNLWKTKDDRYYVSTAIGGPVVRRVMEAIGADDLCEEIDKGIDKDGEKWKAFLDICDERIRNWALTKDCDEIEAIYTDAGLSFQTLYNAKDISEDKNFIERGTIVRVPDEHFDSVLMPGVIPKFSKHENTIANTGKNKGEDNGSVYRQYLGLGADDLKQLSAKGII